MPLVLRHAIAIAMTLAVCATVNSAQRPGPQPTPHTTPLDARPGRLPYYDREWDKNRAAADRERIHGPKPVRKAVALERLSDEIFFLTLMVSPVDRKGILKRAAAIRKQVRDVWSALPSQTVEWGDGATESAPIAASKRRPAYAAQELQSYARGVTDDVNADVKSATPDASLRKQIHYALQRIDALADEVADAYAEKK